MMVWRRLLKADPIDWLLASGDPGLCRAVSVDLLDLPADGEQAAREWSAVLEIDPIAKVLSKQGAEGH